MPSIDDKTISRITSKVQKPGRYVGGELNSIVRHSARIRAAISYPDLYEIGMSNNGIQTLYAAANSIPNVACERVFAVEDDFEAELRHEAVALYTLETHIPLYELDLIGFNLSHELLATGMLQVLDLGGIPLARNDRKEKDPIVIAGGHAVSNPFPYADIADLFFIGDGEDGFKEILSVLLESKNNGQSKAQKITALSGIKGILNPDHYRFSYNGTLIDSFRGPVIKKRVYRGPSAIGPLKPIVPSIRTAHERAVVELTRGCGNMCSYCHAGYYELPYRRCSPNDAAEAVRALIKNTGYNKLTLSSLSIGDYPHLIELLNMVLPELTAEGVSLSLPSLRVDIDTLPIIEISSEVRKTSLTFAIESGMPEIRRKSGKTLENDDLFAIMAYVFKRNWRTVKLYFMLGMPGCAEFDEAGGIVDFLHRAKKIAGKRGEINVTISPFVPKPHTPFELERQNDESYLKESLRRIRAGAPRNVSIKSHSIDSTIIEGVFSRGDERLGRIILAAYKDGCRLDSWDEHFKFDVWKKHFDEKLPFWREYLSERKESDNLPWKAVDPGYTMLAKLRRIKPSELKRGSHADSASSINREAVMTAKDIFAHRYSTAGHARITFSKTGWARNVPHNDFLDLIKRSMRMAAIPVAMTQGFNKRERISAGYPLPLGIESVSELIDIDIFEKIPPDAVNALNSSLPDGILAESIKPLKEKESLMSVTKVIEYIIETDDPELSVRLQQSCRNERPLHKTGKNGKPGIEIKFWDAVHSWEPDKSGTLIRLFTGGETSIRADQAARSLIDAHIEDHRIRIIKTAQYRLRDGLEKIL
jgi:radical SAM family uncharacterized protein/radical SAM-linked protein